MRLWKKLLTVSIAVLLVLSIFASQSTQIAFAEHTGEIKLKVIAKTKNKIYIQWKDWDQTNKDIGYDVYLDNKKVETVSGNTYIIENLLPSKDYSVKVKEATQSGKVSNTIVCSTYSADLIKPVSGHPRLYIHSQSDIDELQRKINTEKGKEVWDMVVAQSEEYSVKDMLLQKRPEGHTNHRPYFTRALECTALRYLVTNDREIGRRAVDMTNNYLDTVQFASGSYYKHVQSSEVLHTSCIVYDWCYDLLTAQEKVKWVKKFKYLAGCSEYGYPPKIGSAVSSHASGTPIMRDLLAAGIASYDEDPELYNIAAELLFEQFIPVRNFIYESGMHHQGTSYGPERCCHELYSALMFKRMGYDNVYGKISDVPLHWVYARRPDGQLIRDGDTTKSKSKSAGEYWDIQEALLLGQAIRNDSYIQYDLMKGYKPGTTSLLFEFLFINFEDDGTKFNLPLSKYFGSPIGTMIARTGWEYDTDPKTSHSSPVMIAEMKVGEYQFNNHMHYDAGQFEIYYKGNLAIDAGIYEGQNTGYGKPHDKNYHKSSIAHNTMLIFDTTKDFTKKDIFFQRMVNNWDDPRNLDHLLKQDYKTGEVLAHAIGPDSIQPDYSYIKGALADAYSDVDTFNRSFVFLNFKDQTHPGALLVYDKVKTPGITYQKTWLLHSIEEPVVQKNVTTIKRETNPYQAFYNGKLVNHTLLPELNNLNITKIGGEGHEFEVFGKNYKAAKENPRNSDEEGAWRIEISPKTKKLEDNFLNVLQAMDNRSGPEPLPVEKVESSDHVGAVIADRVVLFGKSAVKLKNKTQFNITSSKNIMKFLITDLATGFWNVTRNGSEFVGQYEVKPESGALYFSGEPGHYTLKWSATGTATVPSTETYTELLVPSPLPTPIPFSVYPQGTQKYEEASDIRVHVNGKTIAFDMPILGLNGHTIVPCETLFDAMGVDYRIDMNKGTVTCGKMQNEAVFFINQNYYMINQSRKVIPVPVDIVNDKVFVPLRTASESLGYTVGWNSGTRTISIEADN